MAVYRRPFLRLLSNSHPHQLYLTAAPSSLSSATRILSPTAALFTPSRPFAFFPTERCPLHIEKPVCATRSGFTTDGNFSYDCNRRLGLMVCAVLVGQAAVFLGLSNDSALAQDGSDSLGSTNNEQAEGNTASLRRIEDGSVISNEHTVKWRIFTDNARDFLMKGKLDESEKFFQSALHEAKEGFGPRDPHVASALNNLAEFYRLKKEYEKAELLYLEAIEILEESFGSGDIRVGTALHTLGMCYQLQCKLTEAQTCYERALKIEGRVMGIGHPECASTMYLLAKVLSLQGKRNDAEPLILESIRILEESGLRESPTCIQRMRYFSTELLKSHRFSEAENWQRKILHNLELSKGWDSLETTHAAEILTFTLQTMGKFKESEELLERCLEVRKGILSEDHFQVASVLVNLARLSMLKFISDLKSVNSNCSTSDLVRAKQLVSDSIRIIEGILNRSRRDLNKLKSASATDRDKIAAIGVLLQALELVGLLEIGMKHMLAPGPEELFHPIEQALHNCISLYKEAYTRSLVSKAVNHDYLRCLRRLTGIIRDNCVTPYSIKLQELLGEAQQIMEKLGKEGNSKK